MAELFCNGGAMRGGNLHHNVSAHTFLGTVRTAPKYRFFSVRDEFPALLLAEAGGARSRASSTTCRSATFAPTYSPRRPRNSSSP